MVKYYGFNMPFMGGPQNILSRQEDIQLIRNDILQLLLTLPGERVMRPQFGTPLRGLVFDTLTSEDLASAQDQIARAIRDNEPRVLVESVVLQQDADRHKLFIKIVSRLKKDPNVVITIDRFINSTGATDAAR